jgi:hypothetical protein
MVQILQATLSVLEHNEFAGKNEKSIAELRACLRETILVLDQLSRVPPDLPRFSQPVIAGVSRFKFEGEYISPPS